MSHTPLTPFVRAALETEKAFFTGISRAAERVAEWSPDLTVVFFPDHLNGFNYNLLPAFCIGIQGESIGDWGTVPGRIDVPEDLALDCARACLKQGVDVAISYRMRADHGYAQVVEYLSEVRPLARTIPIFINCAAPPLPTFARCRALGEAVGLWAEGLKARVLFLGSGGLSHDPPAPNPPQTAPESRPRAPPGTEASHVERLARQHRGIRAAQTFVRGENGQKPLNPEWDRAFLDSLVKGSLNFPDQWTDEQLSDRAGRGAHEVRTWLAAWAAVTAAGTPNTEVQFSAPIPEWITACAIAMATPART
jgi:2,3-dihydroxyphenylpropionate 1,2-dioxygenase